MNRRYAFNIVFALLLGFLLPSCEVSDNGDLDGFWYLTRLDSIQTGTTVDMHNRQLTWSFQMDLMQTFDGSQDHWDTITMFRFEHTGKQLIISEPFIYDRLNGDKFLTPDRYWEIRHYGINSVPDIFMVDKLNRKHLHVHDDVLRLYFEKR